MQSKVYGLWAGLIVLAGLLSACAPNPSVFNDRVYGSTTPSATQPPPPATATVVVPRTSSRPPTMIMPTVKPEPVVIPDASVTISNKKPPKPKVTLPKSATPAPIEKPLQSVPAMPSAPRVYQSSPAVQALLRQAEAEVTAGSATKAAETIERALRIEPDNPALWLKLSKLNEQQGNRQQAASMAEKAKYYQELLN